MSKFKRLLVHFLFLIVLICPSISANAQVNGSRKLSEHETLSLVCKEVMIQTGLWCARNAQTQEQVDACLMAAMDLYFICIYGTAVAIAPIS